jgi:hypothetical protein
MRAQTDAGKDGYRIPLMRPTGTKQRSGITSLISAALATLRRGAQADAPHRHVALQLDHNLRLMDRGVSAGEA